MELNVKSGESSDYPFTTKIMVHLTCNLNYRYFIFKMVLAKIAAKALFPSDEKITFFRNKYKYTSHLIRAFCRVVLQVCLFVLPEEI